MTDPWHNPYLDPATHHQQQTAFRRHYQHDWPTTTTQCDLHTGDTRCPNTAHWRIHPHTDRHPTNTCDTCLPTTLHHHTNPQHPSATITHLPH